MRRPSDLVAVRMLVIAPCLLACTEDPPLPPPGKNMTGPVTTSSAGGAEGESETGTPSDTPGCDPLGEPLAECGPDMACDLTSLTCVPALGAGLEDDPCADTDTCAAGLVCAEGRCRALCDATTGEGCSDAQICARADAPIPGLCLASCELVFGFCVVPGDACRPVLGPGDELFAACVPNPGAGVTGDACDDDTDCAPEYLCTPAILHTLPCADDAARCCAPICDPLELPCFGLEPICYTLGIPGQESAGYCGAE